MILISRNVNGLSRTCQGSSLLELPVVLWVLFVVLFLPMLGLASLTLRSSIMDTLARDAVHAAAKAHTFATDSTEGPSAISLAESTVRNGLSSFPGISASDVDTQILAIDILSGAITRSGAPLSEVDSSKFIYQLETSVRAQVDPVFPGNSAIFGNVPGLSVPMNIQYTAREMFENAQGLRQ